MSQYAVPTKVLLILSGGRVGGAERQALSFATHAARHGIECTILTVLADDASPLLHIMHYGSILAEARAAGIATAKLDLHHPLSLRGIGRFIRLVRSIRPAAIYTFGLRADIIARPFSWLAGCHVVISSIRNMEDQRGILEVLLDRWTSPLVSKWISNTSAGKTRFTQRERLPAAKITVVPNGIEPKAVPASRGQFRSQWSFSKKHYVIGTVASLRPQKGHINIIEAACQLLPKYPDMRFIFIGDGPLRAELEQKIISKNLVGRVVIAGYIDQPHDALADIDLFLLASYYEGMPNALMEAMMAERCCIATDVGDVAQILDGGRCGILVPPGDPTLLANAIATIASDPKQAHQYAKKARQRVLETYSAENSARQIADVIKAVVNG